MFKLCFVPQMLAPALLRIREACREAGAPYNREGGKGQAGRGTGKQL